MKFLELISADRNFRALLIKHDDNLMEDIYKYVENPKCGNCINKLSTYANQNIDFINTIIKSHTADPAALTIPPAPVIAPVIPEKVTVPEQARAKPQVMTPLKVAGEVYEIDADPNQFKELIETSQSQRWIFRGLNILEKVNSDGKKVWMVFFY